MNRVLLPDEYDQIYKDLEPFWGIHPDELPARQLAAEAREVSSRCFKSQWDGCFVDHRTPAAEHLHDSSP